MNTKEIQRAILCAICLVGAHVLAAVYDGDAMKVVIGMDIGVGMAYFGIKGAL